MSTPPPPSPAPTAADVALSTALTLAAIGEELAELGLAIHERLRSGLSTRDDKIDTAIHLHSLVCILGMIHERWAAAIEPADDPDRN